MQPRPAIGRDGPSQSYVLTNDVSTTPAIPYRGEAYGMLYIPTGYTAASLTPYVCDTEDGTYVPLQDATGTAISIDVSSPPKGIPMPVECFGAFWVKLVQGTNDATPIVITTKG